MEMLRHLFSRLVLIQIQAHIDLINIFVHIRLFEFQKLTADNSTSFDYFCVYYRSSVSHMRRMPSLHASC